MESPVQVEELPVYPAPKPFTSIRFSNLSIENGLSQSTVLSIVQDPQGFLWFGTQDGLNRYDGYEIKTYRPRSSDPYSLTDRWISSLFVDRDGYLWIGTRQGGLNRYDPYRDQFSHYRYHSGDNSGLSSDNILCIAQGDDGNIWVGTNSGLDRLDLQSGQIQHYRHSIGEVNSLSGSGVTALYTGEPGTVWVGTDSSTIDQLKVETGTFRHYRHIPGDETSLPYGKILSIQNSEDGKFWVATPRGIGLLDPETGKTKLYPTIATTASSEQPSDQVISQVYLDRGGTLWIGTDQGINWLDVRSGIVANTHHIAGVSDSLSNNMIRSVYEDREGVLWFGTYGGGVDRYDRNQEIFSYYRHDPENSNSLISDMIFNFFVESSGNAWIATVAGLDYFDLTSGQFTHYIHDPVQPDSLSDNFVWSVIRDHQGKLWVGTRFGLDQLDEKTGQFRHYRYDSLDPASLSGEMVCRIYIDSASNLWVGTDQGLDRFDPAADSFVHYRDRNDVTQITADMVVSIFEDNDHRLWVGTFNSGLFRLDPTRQDFTYYRNDPRQAGSLSNDSIMAIDQDNTGKIWVATTNGLNRYEPSSDSFTVFQEQDGLANNVVYSALSDQSGFLWLSTDSGVSRFDPKSGAFRNFTSSDGLQGNEFDQGAYAQGPDGTIYLGGVNGFNIFRPESVSDNSYLPPVVMTALKIDGQPVNAGASPAMLDQIVLRWPQDTFEFDFAGLSFAEPQYNQYAYKLENFDREWNQIGTKRSGRYTNLPGGTYTLRLSASNNDGVWNEDGKTIRVNVIAPFWKTQWFYGLTVLIVFGCVASIYRWRVHQIEGQKQELERQVNERAHEIEQLFEKTKELAVIDERNRLARELHDSAKQKAFASLAQLGTANGLIAHDPAAAQKHLKEAENLVSEVIQELTFLIQEMYPITLQEKGLATALVEYLYDWEARTDIRVNVKIEEENHLPLNKEQAIYRIVQESFANIARHSRATRVDFSIVYHDQMVDVCIRDNGQGFDLHQKPNGIGLRSMHERAKSVGGNLEVESTPGEGTRVLVQIPALK
jgi:ligand-binding sensor domain-containing protein/signal transduction histidine kinase